MDPKTCDRCGRPIETDPLRGKAAGARGFCLGFETCIQQPERAETVKRERQEARDRLTGKSPATFTTQEGATFGMKGATCPNGHESRLEHRSGAAGYFQCPECSVVYDEPEFDPDEYMGGGE